MNSLILVVVGSQLLFTASDLLARYNLQGRGFTAASFLSWWFVVYGLLRAVATFGQLYLFTQLEVGKTMALFGATSLILVNALGFLILGEKLTFPVYIGAMLAVIAILIIGLSK